ncbi:zinc finger MYND domain-containing protein 15 isoform X10 [Lagenorhynchus albirostris]|uniref:zinc finger MYND domain-containing protein 15 isoform X10 n=1 Tax=Lagenorhynchus albirostris TaxID=27610 RepID=UPI0028EFFF91|nr:zinc finger MYND domain-containing protein 15 isoform X10 [Lagenorhynchus albirostris]
MTQPQTLPSTSLSPYIPPSAQSGPRPCSPEDMEFVSGYRDEFLDFVALLFGWFRKFVAERGAVRTSPEGCWWQLEAQIRRLPQDRALWVLHVLPNRSVGISLGQGAEPGPAPGLGAARLLGDEPPLHLRDLSPYVSFVSLEEGGEEEGAGTEKVETEADGKPAPTSRESPREANPPGEADGTQQEAAGGEVGCQEDRAEDKPGPERRKGQRSEAPPLHLSCLLLVTDEYGTILGIDLLTDGGQGSAGRGSGTQNLAPRAYALLCHSMACPMGSGDPRKPRKLTVGDAQLHRELENLVPRLKVKLTKTPMRTWGPRPGFTFASLRARNCHVCHRHSFEVKLTPCPQCGAVLYCGEACLQADWKRCPDDVSHRFWCPRLAAFMERAGELATLPFTYTTGDPYQLLQGDGPALMPPVPPDPPRGLFVPELNIQNKQSLKIHVMEAGKEFDLIMVFWELLVLLPHVALELQFVGDSLPPESDQQNFTLQRVRAEGGALLFSPNPPAVLPAGLCPSDPCLLSPVLPDASPSTKTSTGFSTPLQTPQDDLEVSVRPGSGVSARLSSGTKEKGGRRDLQIKVSARPYHLLQGPKPDLVIGHLAELAAPVTGAGWDKRDLLSPPARSLLLFWKSLLPHHLLYRPGVRQRVLLPPSVPASCLSPSRSAWVLGRYVGLGAFLRVSEAPPPPQSLRVPAFFTESSEYGCVMDDQTMAVATGGGTSPPQPNPFRSPFRLRAADNCMPWYCNAFIFHLVYKPPQGSWARPVPGPAPPAPTPTAPPAPARRRRGEKKPGRRARRRR